MLSFAFPWEKVENKKYAKTFFQSTACFAKCENQEQENWKMYVSNDIFSRSWLLLAVSMFASFLWKTFWKLFAL